MLKINREQRKNCVLCLLPINRSTTILIFMKIGSNVQFIETISGTSQPLWLLDNHHPWSSAVSSVSCFVCKNSEIGELWLAKLPNVRGRSRTQMLIERTVDVYDCVCSLSLTFFEEFSWNLSQIFIFLRQCTGMRQLFWLKVKVTLVGQMYESVFCVCSISPTFF